MNKRLQIDFEKLFLLALREKEAERLESNLYWLYTLDRSTSILKRLFGSSKLTSEQKIDILRSGMKEPVARTFYSILKLFLDNKAHHRFAYLYKGYVKLLNEKLDREVLTVRSSEKLNQGALEEIQGYLESKQNRKFVIHNQVDPTLIGGLVFQSMHGEIYDFSYKKALSDIKYYILGEAL